jgi:hypothetical protein
MFGNFISDAKPSINNYLSYDIRTEGETNYGLHSYKLLFRSLAHWSAAFGAINFRP